jgi:hypothetical protein
MDKVCPLVFDEEFRCDDRPPTQLTDAYHFWSGFDAFVFYTCNNIETLNETLLDARAMKTILSSHFPIYRAFCMLILAFPHLPPSSVPSPALLLLYIQVHHTLYS